MVQKLSKWKRFKRWLRRGMTPTWFKHITYQIVAFLVSVAMVFGVATYAFTKSYEESELFLPGDFTISAKAEAFEVDDDSIAYISAIISNGIEVCEFNVHSRPNKTLVVSRDLVVTNNDGLELSKILELIEDKDIIVNLNVKMVIDLAQLNRLICEYGMQDRVFVTGLEVFQMQAAKQNLVDIPYYLNYMPSRTKIFSENYQQKLIKTIEDSGAIGINCPYAHAGGKLSETLHNNGYKLSVTGVDTKIGMKRILVTSPNNISTDDYYKLQKLIENWYD